jgi:hypothetical protein
MSYPQMKMKDKPGSTSRDHKRKLMEVVGYPGYWHLPATDLKGRDVLADCRQRNQAVRPPTMDQLRGSGLQQLASDKQLDAGDSDTDSGDGGDDSATPLKQRRACRHSQIPQNDSTGKPTHLRFYNEFLGWVTVLENAKNKFQLFIATSKPFPTLEDHGTCAMASISEAISDFHEENSAELDQGMDSSFNANK